MLVASSPDVGEARLTWVKLATADCCRFATLCLLLVMLHRSTRDTEEPLGGFRKEQAM